MQENAILTDVCLCRISLLALLQYTGMVGKNTDRARPSHLRHEVREQNFSVFFVNNFLFVLKLLSHPTHLC
jgi:hypothetical protein